MATLDDLSGGRAILGLGAGATGFAALGLSHADPATALCEAVELSRQLWRAEAPIHYAGSTTHFVDDRLHRTPRAQIPIYIAGRGEKVLRAAARVADAVLVGNLLAGPGLDYALETIRAGAAERHPELPPLRLAAWAYLSLDDDAEAARDAVKPGVVMAVRTSLNVLMRAGVDVPGQLTTAIKSLPGGRLEASDLSQLARHASDQLVDDLAISGTAADCVTRIRELSRRGFDEIAVLPYAPASQTVDDVLDRFMADVVPHCAVPNEYLQ
jgi:5,10-methylenetetrahydromethanopterin reductase